MNFWKKLFGNPQHKSEPLVLAPQKPIRGLNEQLLLEQELENQVKPLIKKATRIHLCEPSIAPDHSQLLSHFGGEPYFETGEEWPLSKNGVPMDFIFQVFNEGDLILPKEIRLVQFFYDWDKFPWDTRDEGWLVKIYEDIKPEQMKRIDKPNELQETAYCAMQFEEVGSLPDWESIDLYNTEAAKLSCTINEEAPWESYDKVIEKLVGEQHYQSRLGGYPGWIQGESTPKNRNGEPMSLLFQIDSEDNAGIMWGDCGIIYVFYDRDSKHIEFSLQCH